MEDPQASTTFSDSSYQQIPLNDLSDGHGEDDHDQDDIDSLPSTSATTTSLSPSEQDHISDAEREWKESLQQLELLLTMVLVPYLGKYFGRKAAYWGKWHLILHSNNREERESSGQKRANGCCNGR